MTGMGDVINQYTVRMRHDAGTVTLTTAATSARVAVQAIITAERAPLRAVEWVRMRPLCEYCTDYATRYVRDSGESEAGMPLCVTHARETYGSRSELVGKLGVSRMDVVTLECWAESVDLMRQYADEHGWVITGQMYAEQDAHTVTWFTADSCVWLALKRSPRGLWAIETSDFVHLSVRDYDRRFPTPESALEWASQRAVVSVNEVDEW